MRGDRGGPGEGDPRAGLLSWVEIDAEALASNLAVFRERIGPRVALMAVVKSNAYGHGLEPIARIAAARGADAFGVHSVDEAERLAALGTGKRVLILGYVGTEQAERAVSCGAEVTVFNEETLSALSVAAIAAGRRVGCHLKIETGVHRQGVSAEQRDRFLEAIESLPGIFLAGVSTHFANIEDTTDHSYARLQLDRFREAAGPIRERHPSATLHCACSAAALTMPAETSFDMVRIGISLYGLWPSKETLLSCRIGGPGPAPLSPVMTWKTRIAQIKEVPEGAYVGYGCEHRTSRPTRIAVLPIGYADGFDRRLSGAGRVLIGGRRAPVLGRVCMNVVLVDVTDIPGCRLEDEAVLIGRQGGEEITAGSIAAICNTIHYEIVAGIAPQIPRIVIERAQAS